MKKLMNVFAIISLFYLGMNSVCASENDIFFTNMNGVKLTEKEYNNLLKGFSHDTINTMDEEMINGVKDSEKITTVRKTKYIKSTEVYLDGEYIDYDEEEITEEEFNNSNPSSDPLYTPYGSASTSTSYRTLTLDVTVPSSLSTKYVTLTNYWKKMPAMKTYDVLAISPGVPSINFNMSGHKSAYQKYDGQTINYASDGDKWKKIESNTIWKKGIGISQNLVDAAKNYIENSMTVVFLCGEYPFPVRGAYAHAIVDTPLDTSKKYTLDPSGIGNLILFNSSVRGNYENSTGLEVTWDIDELFG